MSIPKRHHYVPRFLLKNFTDAAGWLHWAEVGPVSPVLRRARPNELFHKRHLYSTLNASGEKDVAIERDLAKLEDATAPLVEQMIVAARADRLPDLSDADHRLWNSFLATQWRRTPETRAAVASEAVVTAMLDDIIVDTKRLFPHRIKEIETLMTPEARKRAAVNAWATTLPQPGGDLEAVLKARGILILRITPPNKAFVMGSRPVVKITPGGHKNLRDPVSELWLPVASDVVVGLGQGTQRARLMYLEKPEPIRQLNLAISSQSGVVAGRSASLVRSVAAAR